MTKKPKPEAAKVKQGYREQAGCCFECARFSQRRIINSLRQIEESEARCMLGGFEVNRTATCDEYEVPF